MLNFETEMIINLRDIIWLNQLHKQWILKKPNNQPNYGGDDGVEFMIHSGNKDQSAPEDVIDQDELKKLNFTSRCVDWRAVLTRMQHKWLSSSSKEGNTFDQANVALYGGRVIDGEPTTCNQAWNHEDPKVRENWRAVIDKEFDEMSKKKVWEIINEEDTPKN
jgi:hypothetical protein